MDKIIGIGKVGCGIAEQFSEYPEYRVYKISDTLKEKGTLLIDKQTTIDDYEKNFEDLEYEIYLRSIKEADHALVVVEGGSPISGICLRLAEVIKEAKISVLYVCPDWSVISETQKRDDRIVFNVFQEYARSGVFESIYLAHAPNVETLVGNVSIPEYEESFYRSLSYVVAMVNYYEHVDPVLSTKTEVPNTAKIKTLGISSFDASQPQNMNFLFPLRGNCSMHFLYGIPPDLLEEDSSLIGRMKKYIQQFGKEGSSTCYSVYESTLKSPMVFCSIATDKIQTLPE